MRAEARINLAHLEANIKRLMQKQSGRPMLVLKANAYGHGAVRLAHFAESIGVSHFALASLDEAIELREAGIQSDLLIFGYTSSQRIKEIKEYNLIQSLVSKEQVQAYLASQESLRVHVKVDSGMSRLGLDILEARLESLHLIQAIKASCLQLEGIYTHLASSDSSGLTMDALMQKQVKTFQQFLSLCQERGLDFQEIHLSNSSATARWPGLSSSLCRLGIAAYGASQDSKLSGYLPVLSLVSSLVMQKRIKKGRGVGYGPIYSAKQDQNIGIVASGYADGIPIKLSNRGQVQIEDKLYPIVGRVCMDRLMINLGDDTYPPETEVIIYGGKVSLDQVARQADTITYDLLCRLSPRVNRIYYSAP